MAEIDKLSIAFESDTTEAVQAIDRLADALQRLNQGLDIDGNVATTLNSLSRLDKIAAGMNGDNITAFSKGIQSLVNALKPLEKIGKSNLGSTLKYLSEIPKAMSALDNTNLGKFGNQMDQLSDAVAPLASKSTQLTNVFNKMPSAVTATSNALDNYGSKARSGSTHTKGLISMVSSVADKLRNFTTNVSTLGGAFSYFFNESSEYIEQLNLFRVAMGSAAGSAEAFAQKVSDAMGIDPGEWMEYQGTLKMMIEGFGVASDKAQIMSQNLTQLSYDYSSLLNVDVSSAFDKIQSAMSGQIKGLKDYGNNVSVAMVKQTGLQYGLQGSVSDWDQNTQAIMRYITIMNNAKQVNVFNDMARTINTPANAVRILAQQFTMLKRAIGNIASVLATAVIPYIQVAISLLNKFANFVAGLFGFKLPSIDYSGISKGASAMDDMADSSNNMASGANNAGSAVAGTTKKVKDLKKALQTLSFDELNILNNPDNNSDDGGSGGGGGGAGGGGLGGGGLGGIGDIELPQYDFLAGLKKSTDEIEKQLKHLFKPLLESWNQYGKEVMESMKFAWNEIWKLIKSIGASLDAVWQDGTGKKTVDEILKIVINLCDAVAYLAKRFREAWDSADLGTGIIKNLWKGFNNLLKAAEDISLQLRDWAFDMNFKPLLKSVYNLSDGFRVLANIVGKYLSDAFRNVLIPFGDWSIKSAVPRLVNALADALKGVAGVMKTLRPLTNSLEKLAWALAKLAGNAIITGISALAKALKAVGDSKALLASLSPTIAALIASMAFGKVIVDLDNTKTLLGKLADMVKMIRTYGIAGAIREITSSLAESHKVLKEFGIGFQTLNSATGILSGVSGAITNLGSSIGVLTVAEGGAVTATNLLGSVFAFLAANPLVAVVGAVTVAVGALALLSSGAYEGSKAQEKALHAAESLSEGLRRQAREWKDANDEASKSVAAVSKNTDVARDYASRLFEIVDANGKVTGSVKMAQEFVDKLNEMLGTNIQIHNGVIDNWGREKENIQESITLLQRKAVIEAYAEKFAEADIKRNEAQAKLNETRAKYNESLAKEQEYLSKINEAAANHSGNIAVLTTQYQDQCAITDKYGKALDNAKSNLTNVTEGWNNYDTAMKAADGTVESTTAYIVESYGILAKDGTYTYSSLANGLNELNKKCDQNGKVWQTLSKTEQEASIQARNQLLSDLVQKAVKQGKTYNEMLSIAKSKGAEITAADKVELKKQYDNESKHSADVKAVKSKQNSTLLKMLDDYGFARNGRTAKLYQKELKDAQSNGTKQGEEYINNLKKKLAKDGSKVSDETGKIGKKSKENFESHKAELKVDTSKASKAVNKYVSSIPSSKTMELKLTTGKQKLKVGDASFDVGIKNFARGGFPDSGQMFIAREAGPELVGRIGRKTAVANNDQIVQGIASAVRGAMSGVGNPNGGTTRITIQNVLNGRQIGESVIEYHNGKVKQTGHSPLLF